MDASIVSGSPGQYGAGMSNQAKDLVASRPAWGYVIDGDIEPFCYHRKPTKSKRGYSCAFLAMGFKPTRVRVITEATYQRLRRKR